MFPNSYDTYTLFPLACQMYDPARNVPLAFSTNSFCPFYGGASLAIEFASPLPAGTKRRIFVPSPPNVHIRPSRSIDGIAGFSFQPQASRHIGCVAPRPLHEWLGETVAVAPPI
uniref:Uncharacterized protein n=1 Tax=Coccidioides posadasii RMSCC 3488 TaxID=454284 RepID=A0A0J6F373_COCPO|nr:hypothetical protein CPAG_00054 [Coccidioides posadasii RMSCC 3488]